MSDYSELIKLTRMDTNEDLYFQSVSSFSSNKKSTITNYPTSEGTPKSDNIYAEPETFTCSVQVGGNENIDDDWGVGEDRPQNALTMLTYFKDHAIQFQIETPQATYFNMYLTGITPSATKDSAFNLSVSLTFTQLFIAKYETVIIGGIEFDKTPEGEENKAQESPEQNNGNNSGYSLINSGSKFIDWLFSPTPWGRAIINWLQGK